MKVKEWHGEPPPHEKWVEVREVDGRVLQARAIWGDPDTGVRPYWEDRQGNIYHPSTFFHWREIDG